MPAGPVSASMRRTFAALEPSDAIAKMPIAAVLATWVPPQSSRETPSTSTTRTQSPYFSPNSAIAPRRSASIRDISSAPNGVALLDPVVDAIADVAELLVGQRSAVGEVEAELVGPHGRARLAHVRAEALPEGRVEQVGRGVVAHRREASDVVHLRLDPGRRAPRSSRGLPSSTAWSSPIR